MSQRQKISAVQSDVNKVSSCGAVKFAFPMLMIQAHDGLKEPGPQESASQRWEEQMSLKQGSETSLPPSSSWLRSVLFPCLWGRQLVETPSAANLLRRSSKTMRCLPGTSRHCWQTFRLISSCMTSGLSAL